MLLKWLSEQKRTRQITNFLKRMELGTTVEITKKQSDTGFDYYDITVDNTHHFEGFSPLNSKNVFTLQISRYQKTLDSGIDVEYIEAFVFKTNGFIPYQFIIHQYPQTQTIYLIDEDTHKKGSILYSNSCLGCCGGGEIEIACPVFTSEMVDPSRLLE